MCFYRVVFTITTTTSFLPTLQRSSFHDKFCIRNRWICQYSESTMIYGWFINIFSHYKKIEFCDVNFGVRSTKHKILLGTRSLQQFAYTLRWKRPIPYVTSNPTPALSPTWATTPFNLNTNCIILEIKIQLISWRQIIKDRRCPRGRVLWLGKIKLSLWLWTFS